MTWDLRPPFLNDSNPCGDLINRLKYFRIWFRFPQYIWSKSSKNLIPHAVCMILRSQNFRLSENKFFSLQISCTWLTVWCTPWCLTLQWDAHRRAWLFGMMHTAELNFTVFITPWSQTISTIPIFRVLLFVMSSDSV